MILVCLVRFKYMFYPRSKSIIREARLILNLNRAWGHGEDSISYKSSSMWSSQRKQNSWVQSPTNAIIWWQYTMTTLRETDRLQNKRNGFLTLSRGSKKKIYRYCQQESNETSLAISLHLLVVGHCQKQDIVRRERGWAGLRVSQTLLRWILSRKLYLVYNRLISHRGDSLRQ